MSSSIIGGLHVEDTGNPDGPPVLFIHGFMSSNLQWEPNRRGLGAELRLLLVEQPGHGRSPEPAGPAAYTAETILEQLETIRAELGLDRWWVAGQSLGGAMVVRYALRHPDRVRGLVFTNSRAVFGIAGRRADKARDGGRRSGGLPRSPTRDQVRALPYHPANARRLPPDLQARMVEAADAMPLTVFGHLRAGGSWKSSDDLHQIEVPTLLVNGRFETAFQPCAEQAAAAVPDIRVVDLDGGHSVNIDQPGAFDRAVLDFVRST